MNQKRNMLRIAMDIGSTVSVMGWQLFAMDERDAWQCAGEPVVREYPTVFLEKEKNPTLAKDLFADDALAVLQGGGDLVASAEFKRDLYDSRDAESPRYKEAWREAVLFLRYLYGEFVNGNPVSQEAMKDTRIELRFTVPVVASPNDEARMRRLLAEAGFNAANGFEDENIHMSNEARTLADLAYQEEESPLRKEVQKLAAQPDKRELVLLVDIGGLTADISVTSLRYDQDAGDMDICELASWPSDRRLPPEALGGGVTLDMALCRYLTERGFVSKEAAEHDIKKRKYMSFRRFKEEANGEWLRGEAPKALPRPLRTGAPRAYTDFPAEQLYPAVVIEQVAADYMRVLKRGIREALARAAEAPKAQGLDLREETVDWLFLTGGGSKVFFMEDMLLGRLNEEDPLRLEKLRAEPERLLTGRKIAPTRSCVHGALRHTGKLQLSSRTGYGLGLDFYAVRKDQTVLIDSRRVPIVECWQDFPYHSGEKEYTFTYRYSSGYERIACQLTPYQDLTADGAAVTESARTVAGAKNAGAKALDMADTVWQGVKVAGTALGMGVTKAAPVAAGLAVVGAGALAQGALRQFGINVDLTTAAKAAAVKVSRDSAAEGFFKNAFDVAVEGFQTSARNFGAGREFDDQMTVRYQFDISADGELSMEIKFFSEEMGGENSLRMISL